MRRTYLLLLMLSATLAVSSCGKPNPLGPDEVSTLTTVCTTTEVTPLQSLGSRELSFGSPGARQTPYSIVVAEADSNVLEAEVTITYIGADGNEPPPIAGWAQNLDDPERRAPAVWGEWPNVEPAFYFPNANGTYRKKMWILLAPGRYKIMMNWDFPHPAATTGQITGTLSASSPNQTQWHPEGSITAWLHRWYRSCQ